jgi:hypothetical protein
MYQGNGATGEIPENSLVQDLKQLAQNLGAGSACWMNVNDLPIDSLRAALWANHVSFPAQVPVFSKLASADRQRQVVQLYFLRGWSAERIGQRYSITDRRVRQIVTIWTRRAVQLGFIQYIPPSDLIAENGGEQCLSWTPPLVPDEGPATHMFSATRRSSSGMA